MTAGQAIAMGGGAVFAILLAVGGVCFWLHVLLEDQDDSP